MLEVKNLTVRYGKKIAIKNATFNAHNKEIVGLIGADGAGKSSTLHAIAGVQRFEGEVVFNGYAYHSPAEAEPLKSQIALMPQGLGLVLYPDLSVKEHFEFFKRIRGVKDDPAYEERLLKMAGLYKFQDRLAKNLSGGMKQKLSLICTLLHRPKLLILDEPTTGVDPLSRRELWEILDETRHAQDIVILYSTAYMQEAQQMDKILLFDEGEIIAQGKAEELLKSAEPYTYEETSCDECFCFDKRCYSLKPLPVPHAKPTLEALFFINALKKGKKETRFQIKPKKVQTPPIIVEAKGLTKRFGDFVADDHIDLTLHAGEILGLLGANGAGKTTFIKMLLGLYPIDEGELWLLGKKIESYEDRIELKNYIGYMSQNFALYKDMTIKENMEYFGKLHELPSKTIAQKIEELSQGLGFAEYLDEFPTSLPMGINQRFSLATAILHEPVVLFLDEPTSGVDTIARAGFWKLLHELKRKWRISILITTHYMSEAEYCDRVVVLKEGKKIVDDTPQHLHELYPGLSFEEIFINFYKETK
ncbi:MAG: ABC transporter ATP-binding protein [Epsilonproteobacteria bacterium]|nr:ABC transporter ATP-binding protein [Campylobacterota bacterium]NPA64619.1 ABC transporter ATP-binding protein [Campylobacterota bacterium]